MLFEHLACSDAFDDLRDLLGQHHRDGLNQEMHVVIVRPDFKKVYFIAFRNLKADFPKRFVDWFGEYHLPVFGNTHEVVQHHRHVVFFVYEDTHQTRLSRSKL